MLRAMNDAHAGLVDIARDFLDAHRQMRGVFARHRDGSLRFEELAEFVGDDERSVLFRLKERCHASFRSPEENARPMLREALFDLAVGSLFHEAMKFRENLYQREIYGPRVQALRSQAGRNEAALFEEFARIQEGVSERLDEGLAETEVLLSQTLEQLRLLLAAHRDDPLIARFLAMRGEDLESAFGRSLDQILAEVYGDTATGYERAGHSLLCSGYYELAIRALRSAAGGGNDQNGLDALIAYGLGMQAYLARDYPTTVSRLSEWAATRARDEEAGDPHGFVRLAQDAVARIGQLAEDGDRERLTADAAALLSQIGSR